MRSASLAILGLVACGSDGGEPPPSGAIEAEITHYDYAFDIDTRIAHAELTATVSTEGDCLTLPLRADLDASTLTLSGEPATSIVVENGTVTACGAGRRAGEELVLAADLTIPLMTLSTSQVGYSITTDADANDFYYLVSWVGGCDQFGPCDNRPDRFATYTFHVRHPAGFVARCPGAITEVSATETQCDFTADGGPTYSTFGVAAYPAWTQSARGKWGSVDVTVYDRASTRIAAAIDDSYHAGFVAFMEQTFGPYPFGGELRVLTAPTYWSGFEHPGNIVLDDRLALDRSSYKDPVAHVLDHEIAHQWAGDQTTLADTYDFVWKEAMAEYLAYVYEDMTDPAAAAATAIAWHGFSIGSRYFPVPEDKPALFDYYGEVYGPGPMILFRQLEVLSSREAVIAALQSVLGRPHALSVDELVAALSASTGLSLDAYADAWIRGTGTPAFPMFTLTFTPGAGATSTLAVHQVNPNGRTCKFHVALIGANPGELQEVAVDTFRDGVDQTLEIPTPAFAVTRTDIDSRRECLVLKTSVAPSESPRTEVPRRHPWLSGRISPENF